MLSKYALPAEKTNWSSRNFDFSIHPPQKKFVVGIDTDLVFGKNEIFPSSFGSKLTSKLQNRSFNLFEWGQRFYNFESLIRNIFSFPKFLSDSQIKKILSNFIAHDSSYIIQFIEKTLSRDWVELDMYLSIFEFSSFCIRYVFLL